MDRFRTMRTPCCSHELPQEVVLMTQSVSGYFPVVMDILLHHTLVLHCYLPPQRSLNIIDTLVEKGYCIKNTLRLNSFHISTILLGPFLWTFLVLKNMSPSVSYLTAC